MGLTSYGFQKVGEWSQSPLSEKLIFDQKHRIVPIIFFKETQPFPDESILSTLIRLRELVLSFIDTAQNANLNLIDAALHG